jgi:hypothetical protein
MPGQLAFDALDFLYNDVVFPAISEVVFVDEPQAGVGGFLQLGLAIIEGVVRVHRIELVVELEHGIGLVVDLELVQVRIGPA